jgi:ABC-type phosphate/phosphonate transport system substrate-binding protein
MALRKQGGLAALAVVLWVTAHARPALSDEPIRFALYAPWGGPGEARDRHDVVANIKARVEKALGKPVEGLVYAKYREFDTAVKEGRVDVAVLDTVPALRMSRLRIAGAWSRGEDWVLLARAPQRVLELQGQSIAVPATDSTATAWLIEHVLFREQIELKRFFASVLPVPSRADAVKALGIGKAQCAISRRSEAGTHAVVLELGTWPELVVASASDRDATREPGLIAAVREGLLASLGGSYRDEVPSFHGALAPLEPVLAKPKPYRQKLSDFYVPWPRPTLHLTHLWALPKAVP